MIFVLGGAHQGKEAFVMENLIKDIDIKVTFLNQLNVQDGYRGTILIKSIEKSVKTEDDLVKYKKLILKLKELEKAKDINIVLIGEQIGSGIVPIERADRIWRDMVGFFYQFIVKNSEEVYRVWAGIGEKLKG